jgi:hypothetical protein
MYVMKEKGKSGKEDVKERKKCEDGKRERSEKTRERRKSHFFLGCFTTVPAARLYSGKW